MMKEALSKAVRQSGEALLSSIRKEMKAPRKAKSVRVEELKQKHKTHTKVN